MTGKDALNDEEETVVRHARMVKLTPGQLKWDAKLIENIASNPYSVHAGHDQ